MTLLVVLQIISTLFLISYYGIGIYINVKQDAVNQRVVKYAWFHVRDKWTARATSIWQRVNARVSRIWSPADGATRVIELDEFTRVDPVPETEELVHVNGRAVIVM